MNIKRRLISIDIRLFTNLKTMKMTREKYYLLMFLILFVVGYGCQRTSQGDVSSSLKPTSKASAERILLKDWQPESIYKVPITKINKAKYPVIDMHAHHYTLTSKEVAERVKVMDEVGVDKSVVYTNATGSRFDSIYSLYSKYPDRFMVYCGFDFSDYPKEGWAARTVKELQRCVSVGARGVGEIHDKGNGLVKGLHPDDPGLDPVFQACADMKLPINLHIIDPIWMYMPMDSTNDGLMRAWTWKIQDTSKMIGYFGLINVLENTLKRHPNNKFVIAHLGNLTFDLVRLGELFEKYPNFDADIAARFSEFSTIPRTAANFFEKYQDRLVYGTDYGWEVWVSDKNNVKSERRPGFSPYGQKEPTLAEMFRMTFRVLETEDEHFYMTNLLGYKWPLYGLGLSDKVLEKIYRINAEKIISNQ